MNFDLFNDIEGEEKGQLLTNCKTVERNIFIDPYNSIANARPALEWLCKGLMKRNNVRAQKSPDGQVYLVNMVEACLTENLFQGCHEATVVRRSGNNILHANANDESLHIVNEENIAKALKVAKSLYILMQQAFDLYDDFDEAKIPFGDYEVLRRVPKSAKEVVVGDYNYFVCNGGDHFYLQVYPKNALDEKEMLLAERGEMTRERIGEDRQRNAYKPTMYLIYDSQKESDRRYIIYPIDKGGFLLSELNESLSVKQAIKVGLELIETLCYMKSIGEGIHHRNIQPGSVILMSDGKDDYKAYLINMETAKIKNYAQTIYGSLKEILQANAYTPREVRRNEDGMEIDWEKADVYSVAKVILYCVDPKLVKDEVDPDSLYDIFSDEMVDAFRIIFESTLQDSLNLEEFKEILNSEIK